NASIKPVQVSIEGLARHAVSLHVQQAGSVNFVMTTCRSDFAVLSVVEYCSKTRELLPFVPLLDNKTRFFANPRIRPGSAAAGMAPASLILRMTARPATAMVGVCCKGEGARSMTRQLIICCDGTNNNLTGGAKDTNVTKLCELFAPDANDQLLYYDPGVGNPGELPGASLTDTISRIYERLHGLAFGKGVYENIAEAYLFLMRHYRPGDQIFLLGFSRGAFTARSIGGLVTQFGLLRPEMEGLVPTLLHVYFSDRERGGMKYTAIRDQISRMFASDQTRATPVWFVGVWDTVSSVGAPLLSRTITASRPRSSASA
ncbi:MAG: T6SS phospholipase effector Tle1-like catalytic domain-containing protein, partial [Polaromonas sp.]